MTGDLGASALREKQKCCFHAKAEVSARNETRLVARGTFGVLRWLPTVFCFAVAAVMAYWAYGSFDAISSPDNDTAPSWWIAWGSILSVGSVAAALSGVMWFALWPRFRDRDPRPRRARRSH
jgi:hypothetical protein